MWGVAGKSAAVAAMAGTASHQNPVLIGIQVLVNVLSCSTVDGQTFKQVMPPKIPTKIRWFIPELPALFVVIEDLLMA